MKGPLTNFPIIQTKVPNLTERFNLNDPEGRKKYFEAKVGVEINKIKKYLEENTFIAYFLGKKNSGKGTYTKLMSEIFGADKIGHISVGDLVRTTYKNINDPEKKKEIVEYLEDHYRGYISIEDSIDALVWKNQKVLLPTEFILTLLKREIDKFDRKVIFLDGFPRDLDQVQYSLYFRDLADYRLDPDIFVAINIPESVIDERMRNRVVCPKCQAPRNLTTFPTREIGYDKNSKEFFLICDNTECSGARMVGKEGDNAGIESVRERLDLDEKLIRKVMSLHGVPKVLLRNSVPVNSVKDNIIDDYEVTPKYVFKYDEKTGKTSISEEPWIIKDDEGVESYSLLAPPVVVGLIKQLVKALKL
ncbi:MAG: nucleoside monophosphate kinase [Candidatus Nomurabacteria bacterium]|nr:nucleoside monophosphate kinase [Candidatus Nomurabacteria bacterium]